MKFLRDWFLHFYLPHYPGLDTALVAMAIARCAGLKERRVDSCICGGFTLRCK
jgi:hypothetical protein